MGEAVIIIAGDLWVGEAYRGWLQMGLDQTSFGLWSKYSFADFTGIEAKSLINLYTQSILTYVTP